MKIQLFTSTVLILLMASFPIWGEETPTEQKPDIKWLPNSFQITGYSTRENATWNLETPDTHYGYITRVLQGNWPEYILYYVNGKIHARATVRESINGSVDVVSSLGKKLGNVTNRFWVFTPKLDIYNNEGEWLATLKLNFFGTKATLYPADSQEPIATLTRPYFAVGDKWTVNITDPEAMQNLGIDPRLVIMAVVVQTDKEWLDKERSRQAWQKFFEEQAKRNAQINLQKSAAIYVPITHLLIVERDHETVSKNIQVLEPENADEILDSYVEVVSELQEHAEKLEDVNPTKADFEEAQRVADEKIDAIEEAMEANAAADPDQEELLPEDQRIISGIELIMPLLDSNELTEGEKAALVHMMDRQLEEAN
ncbi:MAG: hypothetical protein Q8K75_12770 [Chlamydiales bacterium]|nr:hypothetical protein [Chlamydiales bacterium]